MLSSEILVILLPVIVGFFIGLIIIGIKGSFKEFQQYRESKVRVKKRIVWYLEEKTAVAIAIGELLPTKFQWKKQKSFNPNKDGVVLLWDGIYSDKFKNEIELKLFLIRLIYNIEDKFLIPSELLADANLVYTTGDWVDEWQCTDKNNEIIECERDIWRPISRKIRYTGYRTPLKLKTYKIDKKQTQNVYAEKAVRYKIPAKVEINSLEDEKCFFHFKAGGYYSQKQQTLDKNL